ncbi:MAG: PspC domain-containing protein, partial [Bacteroidota bacterium]
MDNSPGVSPPKKFQRSKNNVVISGVCSGIAEYLNTDAAIIRIIALLTLLLGSWSAVAYLLTALLLPVEQNPKQLSLEEMKTLRKENFRTVLGGLMILTGVHFAFISFGIGDSSRIFILPQS